MDEANEMYTLQKYFGTQEINLMLGNLESYKVLRDKHTFQQIYNEIEKLINK